MTTELDAFASLATARISVRGYRPDPVPDDLMERILDTARMAPSAANRQPWRIVVARERPLREAIHAAYPREWLLQAPVMMAVCVDSSVAWTRAEDGWNAADTDGAILMTHLTLAAAAAGLGTCWIAAFSPDKLRAALNIPAALRPYAMTPLGYPADAGRPKQRLELETIVRREAW